MAPSQVIQTIQQLLPRIKSSSVGAENILLDYAKENNLEPAVLVKMAQTMNTARTLAFLEKNADARGGSFPLLDPEAIGAAYVESKNIQPAKRASFLEVDLGENTKLPNFFKMASDQTEPQVVKNASVETPVTKSARELNREFRAWRDEAVSQERETERCFELREDLADEFKGAFKKLSSFLRENADDASLIGEDVHALGDVQDIAIYEEAIKDANSHANYKLASYNGTPITKRKLAYDRFNILPLIKVACARLKLVENVDFYIKEAKKNTKDKKPAVVGVDPNQSGFTEQFFGSGEPKAIGRNQNNQNSPSEEKDKNKSTFINDIVSAVKDVTPQINKPDPAAIHGALMQDQLPRFRQKDVDTAVDDVRSMSGLQELVIKDPILSEADPTQLVEMYNDLRATKPDIANNKNMMRFALREALQYGGIPQQTVKTIADIDKAQMQAAVDRQSLTDQLYRGGPKPGFSSKRRSEEE